MSHTSSPSVQCPYGVVRVCQEWGLSRATCYHQRSRADGPSVERTKRGPKTASTDEELTAYIRQVLMASPFLGEGAPQSLGTAAGTEDSHLETPCAAAHAAGQPLGSQPGATRRGTAGPRRHDHDRAPESDVGH